MLLTTFKLWLLTISGAAVGSPVLSHDVASLEARQQGQGLNAVMRARGRQYIGTAMGIHNDNSENNVFRGNDFGSATPENEMKWEATEPNRGQWTWQRGDQVANFATQNGKQMRCHALVVSYCN